MREDYEASFDSTDTLDTRDIAIRVSNPGQGVEEKTENIVEASEDLLDEVIRPCPTKDAFLCRTLIEGLVEGVGLQCVLLVRDAIILVKGETQCDEEQHGDLPHSIIALNL